MRAAARGMKHVTLELGGKSPNIVFDDADIEDAVNGVISGIFAATGQTCIAGSRLLVQKSIHDRFVDKLVAFASTARMGDPMSPTLRSARSRPSRNTRRVLSYIDIAKREGARCVLGGAAATRPECGDGWFVEPTIFTGVDNEMRIAREEVFGPVLSIIPFEDEDEAFAIANDTPYGLAAGVWTRTSDGRSARPSGRGRHRLGQYLPGRELHVAVRRLQALGHRPGERPGRHLGISAHQKRLDLDGGAVANPFVMR